MSTLHQIRILSDGKRGHENQSLGLSTELQRLSGAQVDIVTFGGKEGLFSRMRRATEGETIPQMLLATGHRTHLPLLWAAWKLNVPSVLLMRPSLPMSLFSLCVVPNHDLRGRPIPPNVIPTFGMLNRLPLELPVKEDQGLILLGGPSKHHAWEIDPLLEAITDITRSDSTVSWSLTDSRRTPAETMQRLAERQLPLTVHSHKETSPEWLPEKLAKARTVWVTADSASMVSEALTAGAKVAILPAPPRSSDSRVVRSLEKFIKDRWVTTYDDWKLNHRYPGPPTRLHEASRCAELILKSGLI